MNMLFSTFWTRFWLILFCSPLVITAIAIEYWNSMSPPKLSWNTLEISEKESYLIQLLSGFPEVVRQAGEEFSPALIANYTYDLVKVYNQFYHVFSILREDNVTLKIFRLNLSEAIAKVIKTAMGLLGIEVPERM